MSPHSIFGRRWFISSLLLTAGTVFLTASLASACDFCLGESPLGGLGPNVYWALVDSIAACPAGDSVAANFASRHPSKLRIEVWYDDVNCNPRVGVPPESLSITWSTLSGTAAINDESTQIFADDSTDACGHTRFTIPSFSGCGRITVALGISGQSQGSKNVVVRTVDANATGFIDTSDLFQNTCDVNYSGSVFDEGPTEALHTDHWHRNALFGTMVRRTNLCETCTPESTGTIGESELSWSPDGKQLAFTIHVGAVDASGEAACRAFIVRSDPRSGNALRQFTFNDTIAVHDYDPQWSPLGTEIVYDRQDRRILRKGVPGSADTSDVLVTASGDAFVPGDVTPAVSPDGQWVAFSRRETSGARHIYKVPISGGLATQLTTETDGVDFYPQWSRSGTWIVFDRQSGPSTNPHHVYKVKANGDSLQAVYDAPAGKDAATPAFSPDSAIVLFGQGTHSSSPRDVTTRTLNLFLTTPRAVAQYQDSTFAVVGPDPVLSPRLSPDGTRLALRSRQLWAVRRNMNVPPLFTQVGTQSVADSTATVSINCKVGLQSNITVSATDTESDALTYSAFFLQSGMSFSPSTRTLTWTPPGPVGSKNYVRFEAATASGGTDAIIAILNTVSALGPGSAQHPVESRAAQATFRVLGPNPTQGRFAIAIPQVDSPLARLVIFDLSGRRVAMVSGRPGTVLSWGGRSDRGELCAPGEYLFQASAGPLQDQGKFVLQR